MLGADAVVGIKREILAAFHSTLNEWSGAAVRGVDSDGQQAIRLRWFNDEVFRLCRSMAYTLVLMGLLYLVGFTIHREYLELEIVGTVFLLLAGWPILLLFALLVFRLPQLIRPLGVTAFAILIHALVSAFGEELDWAHFHSQTEIKAFFGMFPAAWGSLILQQSFLVHRQYRDMQPSTNGGASVSRALIGFFSNFAAIIYAATVIVLFGFGGYQRAADQHVTTHVTSTITPQEQKLLESYAGDGDSYFELAEFDKALECYRKCAEIAQRLASDPNNSDGRQLLMNLFGRMGEASHRMEKLDEARSLYVSALVLRERQVKDDPSNVPAQLDLYFGYYELGRVEHSAKKYAEAMTWFEKALSVVKQLEASGGLLRKDEHLIEDTEKAISICRNAAREAE